MIFNACRQRFSKRKIIFFKKNNFPFTKPAPEIHFRKPIKLFYYHLLSITYHL